MICFRILLHFGLIEHLEKLSETRSSPGLQVKTTRMFVRDCTPVSPYALMLFGGDLTAEGGNLVPGTVKGKGRNRQQQMVMSESVLCVDGWIKFSVPYSIQTLLLAVRESLDGLLKVSRIPA